MSLPDDETDKNYFNQYFIFQIVETVMPEINKISQMYVVPGAPRMTIYCCF